MILRVLNLLLLLVIVAPVALLIAVFACDDTNTTNVVCNALTSDQISKIIGFCSLFSVATIIGKNQFINAKIKNYQQIHYQDANKHLANKQSSEMRQGGFHTLFHLALDDNFRRSSIPTMLCTHICRTTQNKDYKENYISKPSTEIQSFLFLLFTEKAHVNAKGNLKKLLKDSNLILNNGYFPGADLTKALLSKAQFEDANLQKAHLKGANLQGACLKRANLQGAMLDDADLRKANLVWAKLQGASLIGANLQGAFLDDANLREAFLYDADLRKAHLERANLQGAFLEGANLQGACLKRANLQETNLCDVSLKGANLHRAHLEEADAQRVNLKRTNLLEAKLCDSNLQGACLKRANLQNASLERINLCGANLVRASLQAANLQKANLQAANLQKANLQGADLSEANLQTTDLQKAFLQAAYLGKALLQEANLQDANIQGIRSSNNVSAESFRTRMRTRIEKDSDFSSIVFAGGMDSQSIEQLFNILKSIGGKFAKEDLQSFRKRWNKHIKSEISHQPPDNVITGKFGEREYAQMMAEYKKSLLS